MNVRLRQEDRGAEIEAGSHLRVEVRTEEGYGLTALLLRSHAMAGRICPGDSVRVEALRGRILPDPAIAGGLESAIAAKVVETGTIPPTINYETPDPECDLDYVPNKARQKDGIRHVMSNSFGFGGTNATLIFSRHTA